MRNGRGPLTAVVVLALWAAACVAAAPEITFVPENPRVGDVVFITLRPEEGLLRAACSWGGKSYPFLASGDLFELALPVSLRSTSGAHRATVYWKYIGGGMGKATVSIPVEARDFGVQHLQLSQKQEKTYSDPEVKRERRLISSALDRVGQERWWRESFLMPVEGRISTGFGVQRYINRRLAYRHRGLDIAAPEGTPVRAAAGGVVSLADDSFVLHGQTVIIDHGHGISTLYLHLSQLAVEDGERVSRGQMIGRVGATGVATGPHLHFAVYAYHEAVDPLFWTQLPAH